MQAANPHGYTAQVGGYQLSSKELTEIEHDVAVRRIVGIPHKAIAEELEFSVSNSKKTSERVMDKLIPPAHVHDNDFRPRSVQALTKILLQRKN